MSNRSRRGSWFTRNLPCRCPFCQRAFATPGAIRPHLWREHPGMGPRQVSEAMSRVRREMGWPGPTRGSPFLIPELAPALPERSK
jgi:hypothetical protein